ncbi:uncharacterized protein LOC134694114 [Mytilus trossulus]|uniref:uncharacterized protein LOC134694114 n=1 Tax=Mytilus trossulus TaxID=6551 RepID=UPI003003D22B
MASMVHIGKEVLSEKDVEDIFDSVLSSASSKLKPTTPTYEDEYDCSNRYRGLALIICNENFKTENHRRDYCDDEIKLMKETFGKHLNFTVLIFKDLTAEQINWVIHRVLFYKACKQPGFHRMSDCFACVLASHGGEESRGSNGKPTLVDLRDQCLYGVDHKPITTKAIIKKINDVKALKDKPKLFFIQACRSRTQMHITTSGIEHGHTIDINSASHGNCPTDCTDEFYKQSFPECPTQNEPSLKANHGIISEKKDNAEASIFHKLGQLFGLNKNDAEKIIEPEDMISILDQSCTDDTLVVYSTASEKYSYGRVKLGGWMLVCLNKAVDEQLRQSNKSYHIDLMDILIAVTSAVAKNFETHLSDDNSSRKCAVVFEHCLYKELYFSNNWI